MRAPGKLAVMVVVVVALAGSSMGPTAFAGTETRTGQLKAADDRLQSGEYFDRHDVTIGAGEDLVVTLHSAQFDAYLIVKAPTDDPAIQNDDVASGNHDARVEVEDAAPGTWNIFVTSASPGETGSYELRITRTARHVASGGDEVRRLHGTLQQGDDTLGSGEYMDTHSLSLAAGQRIVVELRSTEFDTYVGLQSPSGDVIENDDWEGSSRLSRVDATVEEAGEWSVIVTSYAPGQTGSYEVTLILGGGERVLVATPQGSPMHGTLSAGDPRLNSGEHYDLYPLAGKAGEVIVIDLSSTDFDPYLILSPPGGGTETWQNDDHQSDQRRSQLSVTLPVDGRYNLYVTSASAGERGSYSLQVHSRTEPTQTGGPRIERGALAQGDGVLTTGEFRDLYEFVAAPGQRAVVELRGAGFDTYLIVKPPRGASMENDDYEGDSHRSRVEVELEEAGTYVVAVTSYRPGESGSYELSISLEDAPERPASERDIVTLRPGQRRTGALTEADGTLDSGEFRDVYVFEAAAGAHVTVDLTSDAFDTYVGLVDPDGSAVENDDFEGQSRHSRVELELRMGGRYRVVVTSYAPGQKGDYAVQVDVRTASTPGERPPVPGGTGRIYGVFVGVSDYPGEQNDLDFCADDASNIRNTLTQMYGMRAQDAVLLRDGEATVENIREGIRRIGPRVGANDLFLFFFSGHGNRVPRGEPQRADPQGLDETLAAHDGQLVDDELDTLLSQVGGGTTLVVIDACFSGGFSKDVITVGGRMGLFSSHEDVTSAVARKFRAGGYLSRFLVEAIGAERDTADEDGDRALTAIELSQFIQDRYRGDVKAGKGPAGEPGIVMVNRRLGYQQLVADRGGVDPFQVLFRW